ncbi:hypothetical protein [Actinomadura rugatobispora]|uniref:Lipoprotein n=1 Tax=Actinomadura rugatobispora TaxID=1994 RepID=A0ABW0ZRM7_9ACTN|nr:hypothetical protein GCM10010200_051310 [Actinomadura rugatobispora]
MTVSRVWILLTAGALAVAGCSDEPEAAPKPPAASAASASPSAKPTSAFCLDLELFRVGAVVYRGGVGRAVRGEEIDLDESRRQAGRTIAMGERMKASAPPDIAPQFTTALEALKTSSGRLKPGSEVRDVLDPVYGKQAQAAFDAVDKYECRAGS